MILKLENYEVTKKAYKLLKKNGFDVVMESEYTAYLQEEVEFTLPVILDNYAELRNKVSSLNTKEVNWLESCIMKKLLKMDNVNCSESIEECIIDTINNF